jgi:hypothetical protein
VIALYDADADSALSFVKQKLRDAGLDLEFTPAQTASLQKLGGRAVDLESVRVRNSSWILESDNSATCS